MKFEDLRSHLQLGYAAQFYGRNYIVIGDVIYRQKDPIRGEWEPCFLSMEEQESDKWELVPRPLEREVEE